MGSAIILASYACCSPSYAAVTSTADCALRCSVLRQFAALRHRAAPRSVGRQLLTFNSASDALDGHTLQVRVFELLRWLGPRHTRVRNQMRSSRSSTVPYDIGPKRSMGHFLGAEKINFLIRDIDDAAMAGASVESCRFVVLRSPRRRLGSILDMGNRLRRMRGRSHRCLHISKVLFF